ncbi:hypothetical protein IJ182_05430 [bacterium]|nr:hypothetical protein [bacterium]
MAKKKSSTVPITENTKQIDIDFNSKNINYKLSTTANTDLTFKVNLDNTKYKGYAYKVKDGNNLKVVTVYTDKTTDAFKKQVTTTIVDYYVHSAEYSGDTATIGNTTGVTKDNANVYELNSSNTLTSAGYLVGSDKNDKINLKSGGVKYVDFNGNDNYDVKIWYSPEQASSITDFKGNDKYAFSVLDSITVDTTKYGESELGLSLTSKNIKDYSGNDSYDIKDNAYVNINDYAGKDKYNVNRANSNSMIYDWGGADNYNIKNTAITIRDYGANDTYNVFDSAVTINENVGSYGADQGTAGNDKYNLNNLRRGSNINDKLGNDTYTINSTVGTGTGVNQLGLSVTDFKGSETYKINGSKYISLGDNAGNDKYIVNNSDNVSISDTVSTGNTGGKDTYTLTNVVDSIITDYYGNDTYKLNSLYDTNINDYNGGADKYTLVDSIGIKITDQENSGASAKDQIDNFTVKNSAEIIINSQDGNDKFNISNESHRIKLFDTAGDENYTIKDTSLVKINDTKGNDKYNFTNVDGISIYAGDKNTEDGILDYSIIDDDGNDTYTFKNSKYVRLWDEAASDNEKNTYNLTSNSGMYIYSSQNSSKYSTDTYNITSGKSTYIIDYGKSNDIYNVKDSSITNIQDKDGSDKYTIKNSNNVVIEDSCDTAANTLSADKFDRNVYDIINTTDFKIQAGTAMGKASIDTYNISKKSSGTIIDQDGRDDNYKIDKLNGGIKITDYAGNDTLTITGAKANNLIFMADIDKNGNIDINKSIYIYDKKDHGYVRLGSYYYGDDWKIDTIKAGKTEVQDNIKSFDTYTTDVIKSAVSAFLTSGNGKDYGSIDKVLDTHNAKLINELVACFSQQS